MNSIVSSLSLISDPTPRAHSISRGCDYFDVKGIGRSAECNGANKQRGSQGSLFWGLGLVARPELSFRSAAALGRGLRLRVPGWFARLRRSLNLKLKALLRLRTSGEDSDRG